MLVRSLVVLRRAFVRGPAIVLVPALVAGLLVTSSAPPGPRQGRLAVTKASATVTEVPPAAPTDVRAAPGSEKLDVSWTAAADNGFPLISNSVVVATTEGATVATFQEPGGAVAKTVTGLTNGQSYVVTVTAKNAGGSGAPGTSASAIPFGRPSSVMTLVAVAGDRSVTATWEPAVPNGRAITAQRVALRRASDDAPLSETVVAATQTTQTFGDLGNAYAYYVTVVASNEAGDGPIARSESVTPRVDRYRNTVVADGPSVYYRLGETAGATAVDSSGNGRNGTYRNMTLGRTGALADDADTAVNTTSGDVSYLNASGLPVANQPRSFEAWVRLTRTDSQVIAGWGTPSGNQWSYFRIEGANNVLLDRYGATYRVEHFLPKPINDGLWHHLVLTYAGAPTNRSVVYLDGAKVGENTAVGGMNTVLSPKYLGIGGDTNRSMHYLQGSLDEVAIYPRELPATAVAEHFRQSGLLAPAAPPNLAVTPGDELLAIDWDTPPVGISAGESAFTTDYTVEVKANGVLRGRMRTPLTKTDAMISGLPAGVYDVTVKVCNRWGCGTATKSATVTGGAATYASLVQDDRPLVFLRLGERAGTIATDSSTNQRDATYGAQTVLGVNGAVGGDPDPAIKATSTSNPLVRTVDTAFLPTGTSPRTIEAWVRGSGSIASWGSTTSYRAFGVRATGSTLKVVGYNDDLTFTTPVSVDDGGWHHVVVTFDGTTATAYFDGAAVGAGAFPTPLNTATTDLKVGWVNGDGTSVRQAPVDDVAVFPTALTAERVNTHFNAARSEPLLAVNLPEPMAAPTATAEDVTATVSWVPPQDVTGIIRYEVVVTRRDDGSLVKVDTVLAPASSTIVNGLQPGVAYLFAVRAVNNVGAAPDSPQTSATTIPPLTTGLSAGPMGPTTVATKQEGDAVWGPDHSPYVVTNLTLDAGETLTILPGTVVKFASRGSIGVYGQVVAVGTTEKPVVFTSIKDDTVAGDTNADGTASGPARDDWTAISFEGGTQPVSVLDHVEVRYGGGGGSPGASGYSSLARNGVIQNDGAAKVFVTNSRLHDNVAGVGIAANGEGWTSVTHTVFTKHSWNVRPLGSLDLIGNTFSDGVGIHSYSPWANQAPAWRVAYNDFHGPAISTVNDVGMQNVTFTRNNFWATFTTDDKPAPSFVGNYWGKVVGEPPYGLCISWLYPDHYPYWPLLRNQDVANDACGAFDNPVVGYKWDVLPALDAPVSTWATASSSDAAVPLAGPVDTANGVLRYDVTDLELNDAGQAMNVRRSYRSDKGGGVLGRGWSTNYSASMSTLPNGLRRVDFASGASMRFQTTGQGDPGVPATLTSTATEATVTSSDRSSYSFDATGVLTAMTLRDPAHKVELTRTNGNVTGVIGVSGRRFTLAYVTGKLESVRDSAGRDVRYTVASDRLTAVRRAGGGTETYGYDAEGRLTSVTTPMGRVVLRVGYDGQGRVEWFEQGGAGRTTIEYHPSERYTVVHEPAGVDVRQEYDGYNRMVRQVVVGGRTVHVAIGVGSVPVVLVNGVPAEGTTLAPEVTATRLDFYGNPVQDVDGEGRTVKTSFDGQGRPVVTTYADGGTISRHYDAGGRVDSVDDPAGKRWSAEYNAFGQLTRVTDPLLRSRRSVYRANGDLWEQYDVGDLKTTFSTDAVGRVTSVTDPRGKTTYTAYTEWNRVRSVTTPRGAVTTTTFDTDRNPVTSTAPMERATSLTYDDSGRVKTIKDAGGNVTTVTYDAMSRVAEVLAPNGGRLVRTFTADGAVNTATDALLRRTTYEYDNLGNLVRVVDPTSVATVQTYDQSGRLLTRTTGSQHTEVRTYDTKGRLASLKGPRGATVTTTYDKQDRPVAVSDSVRGLLVTRTFDDAGRLATETNALGNVTTLGYDGSDRLTSADDALGRLFVRTFDGDGNMLTDEDGTGFKVVRTYDDDGNVVTETNAGDGGVTAFETDLAGRVVAVVDPLARRTETDYDGLDRVTARRSGTAGRIAEAFSYDSAGKLLAHTDGAARVWRWEYDVAGQMTKSTTPTGGVTSYEYDGAGRVTRTTDPDGVVTDTAYDLSGRPFRTTDGAGAAWVTTYDVDANPVKTTDPDGVSTTFGYDAAGRVVTTTDGAHNVTTTTYDAADDVLTVKDALQHVRSSEYDGRGRRTATIDALGARTTYTWDAANHATGSTDADGVVAAVAYGTAGRPLSFSDGNGRAYVPTYDVAGQLRELALPPQPTAGKWLWTYDDVGNVETENFGGIVTGFEYDGEGRVARVTHASGRVTTITHDGDGRIVAEAATNPATGESGVRSRTYTAAGRLKTALSAEGVTEWTYDALGSLTGSTTSAGTSTTSYTPGGRVRSTSVNSRAGTTATYDDRGLLVSLAGAVNQSYAYDAARRLTKIAYAAPETGVETFGWDDADRLLRHEQKATPTAATAQLSESYEYTRGGRVKRATHTAPAKGAAWDKSLAYDPLGRLETLTTMAADGAKTVERYSWDERGNRSGESSWTESPTGEVTPLSSEAHTHDAAGRLTDAGFTYDDDGNLLTSPGGSFSYDAFGQLAAVSKTTGSDVAAATYGRDGLGRLVRRTDGALTTSFDYVGASLDVSEQRTGTDVTTFVRDPDGGVGGTVSGGAASHVVRNRHTDVTGLVSATTGELTAFAVYEPFGARSGDVAALPLGYQSDYTDPITGSVDMGARAYLPSYAAFTQMDPVLGDPMRPASFNRYLYGAGDPLGSIDPDGHWLKELGDGVGAAVGAIGWAAETTGALIRTTYDFGRVAVGLMTGNDEARDNAIDDVSGSATRVKEQLHEGTAAVVTPLRTLADGVVRPVLDHLRNNVVARQVATIAVGFAVGVGCGIVTGGAGSVGCLALGDAVSTALDSFLTCPPEMSGGECALRGAMIGATTGAVTAGLGKYLPGAKTLAGKVAQAAFVGAVGGATGSVVGQLATTGTVDWKSVAETGMVAGVVGGGTAGAAHALGRARLRVAAATDGASSITVAAEGVEASIPGRPSSITVAAEGVEASISGSRADWQTRVADNGKGLVVQRPGAQGNADMIRMMDPTPEYPNGYVRYYNERGQPLGLNGKPGPRAETHIPREPDGSWATPEGWDG